MSRIAAILLLFGCVGVVGWRGVDRVDQLDGRMNTLERVRNSERRTRTELEAEIQMLRTELARVSGDLALSSESLEEWRSLAGRLISTETALSRFEKDLDAQASTLASLEDRNEGFDPTGLTAHLEQLDAELERRWDEAFVEARDAALIADRAALTAQLAAASATEAMDLTRSHSDRIETLSAGLRRSPDHALMWQDLVGPVVQLAGEESVGSGVLLEYDIAGDGHTYLLTAWHVVRDIQGSLDNRDLPVPVSIFHPDGAVTDTTAALLEFDAGIDIAVLRVNTEEALPFGASVVSRKDMQDLAIFDEIVAVGCPLGNSPIPTQGEIAAVRHFVDGQNYVMINANTYVGNSGGGIFDAESHDLLGIFSKVYTHGSLRPTIVTHMGLITPMSVVYDWLEDVGYGTLVPSH